MVDVRPATTEDISVMFRWINDPDTIRFSRRGGLTAWNDHVGWVSDKLKDDDYRFFIGEHEGKPCGLVWFRKNADGVWQTSLNLDADHRGKKLSAPLLDSAIRMNGEWQEVYTTEVHNDNAAAIHVFRKCGYRLAYEKPGFSTYIRL